MRYVRPIIKQKLRFDVLSRDSFKCQYCGIADSTNSQLVIDHIVPVCDGGTNHILNLSSACIDCNSGKAGKRLSVKNMPEKLRKQLTVALEEREFWRKINSRSNYIYDERDDYDKA